MSERVSDSSLLSGRDGREARSLTVPRADVDADYERSRAEQSLDARRGGRR